MQKTKPKIITILGARPQFIKAAVVTPVLSRFANEILIHTGQHFDRNMSDVFFQMLPLPMPDYHLNIHSASHGDMTGRMLIEMEKILQKENPNLVLVYGDTNSTLAGALAAAKLNIPIAHIEAGVRSFNRTMPEEINRIITDKLSKFYFITSTIAKQNLEREGCESGHIYEVGDVMHDLALQASKQVARTVPPLKDYILVTIHRSENTDDPSRLKILKEVIEELATIKPIIWIMHPRTQKALKQCHLLLPEENKNLVILEPLGYQAMLNLIQNAKAVATDSGGLQKEAYYFKKPCITLRTETEWVELQELGWNEVIGTDMHNNAKIIVEKINTFLGKDFQTLPCPSVYGEGNTAEKIGDILKRILG